MKNKSTILLTILSIGYIAVLSGCVNVPKTKISATINGKPATFEGPKDCSLDELIFNSNPDGTVSMTVKGLKTQMNPDVITTTGAAQSQMIKEIFTGAAGILEKAP